MHKALNKLYEYQDVLKVTSEFVHGKTVLLQEGRKNEFISGDIEAHDVRFHSVVLEESKQM
jgi:hypothetical protein